MEKKTRTYEIEGKTYEFDISMFNRIIESYKKNNDIKKSSDFQSLFCEKMNIGESTYRSWKSGNNAPSTMEDINKVATFFECNSNLLLKEKLEENMTKATERQKDSLKRIYDAVIKYLDRFYSTSGFNDLWADYIDQGFSAKQIENTLYDIAEREIHKVQFVVDQEYIELFRLDDVYQQLNDYITDCLIETYNDKLSYGYRYEAPVATINGGQSGVTTDEDYIIALKQINELLEPYF